MRNSNIQHNQTKMTTVVNNRASSEQKGMTTYLQGTTLTTVQGTTTTTINDDTLLQRRSPASANAHTGQQNGTLDNNTMQQNASGDVIHLSQGITAGITYIIQQNTTPRGFSKIDRQTSHVTFSVQESKATADVANNIKQNEAANGTAYTAQPNGVTNGTAHNIQRNGVTNGTAHNIKQNGVTNGTAYTAQPNGAHVGANDVGQKTVLSNPPSFSKYYPAQGVNSETRGFTKPPLLPRPTIIPSITTQNISTVYGYATNGNLEAQGIRAESELNQISEIQKNGAAELGINNELAMHNSVGTRTENTKTVIANKNCMAMQGNNEEIATQNCPSGTAAQNDYEVENSGRSAETSQKLTETSNINSRITAQYNTTGVQMQHDGITMPRYNTTGVQMQHDGITMPQYNNSDLVYKNGIGSNAYCYSNEISSAVVDGNSGSNQNSNEVIYPSSDDKVGMQNYSNVVEAQLQTNVVGVQYVTPAIQYSGEAGVQSVYITNDVTSVSYSVAIQSSGQGTLIQTSSGVQTMPINHSVVHETVNTSLAAPVDGIMTTNDKITGVQYMTSSQNDAATMTRHHEDVRVQSNGGYMAEQSNEVLMQYDSVIMELNNVAHGVRQDTNNSTEVDTNIVLPQAEIITAQNYAEPHTNAPAVGVEECNKMENEENSLNAVKDTTDAKDEIVNEINDYTDIDGKVETQVNMGICDTITKKSEMIEIEKKYDDRETINDNKNVESPRNETEKKNNQDQNDQDKKIETGETYKEISTHKKEFKEDLAKSLAKSNSSRSKVSASSTCSGPDEIVPSTSLWATGREEAVKLRMGADGPLATRPMSVISAFQDTVSKYPSHLAYAYKEEAAWKSVTYRVYYDSVWNAAKSFIHLGLEPYHGIGILGFNSPEWFISSFAAIFAGGLSTGIYSTNSPEACHFVALNAKCNVIVVEDDSQLQKILKVRDRLPDLKAIVQYRGKTKEKYENVYAWNDFLDLASFVDDEVLKQRIRQQAVNKCCTLIYTSGTTGNPKGVMLSHDNLIWTARMAGQTVGLNMGSEVLVSYLPLSHIAAQILDMYIPLLHAAAVFFAQPDALKGTLVETLKQVRPTAFLGVPRVWEKMQEKMEAETNKGGYFKKCIVRWARDVGQAGNLSRMVGRGVPLAWGLANALVFKKIRVALGMERCKICITAAAPIPIETLMFFASIDLPLMEIYGMSETSGPHTISTPSRWRIGSIGPAMNGAEIELVACSQQDEGGEICMSGRNIFMGYLGEEEKTVETLDSKGLLHSGDLGKLDDGFYYITGRIKELLITAGGENVAPVPIEDAVKAALPCVSNCMLVGDKKKFLVVLLTLKTEMDPKTNEPLDTLTEVAVGWCRNHGVDVRTVSDVILKPNDAIMSAIQEGINQANKKAVSRAQTIQKFSILPRDFSIAGGELGPTLKLKRSVVLNMYQATIDSFYVE